MKNEVSGIKNNRLCAHCQHQFQGNYCPNCGQKVIFEEDKKLKHFVHQFFSSLFFADGKVLKTLKMMIFKPGELSRAYISGDRKSYLAPLQVFFFANLIYFLFPVFSTFNTSLSTQMKRLPYSDMVRPVVENHLEKNQLDYREYREKFEARSTDMAKLILVVLVLLQAIELKVLFIRNKDLYFTDFLAAAAYFNAMYILFLLVLLPSLLLLVNWFIDFDLGLLNEKSFSIIFIGLIVSYLSLFLRRAFQLKWFPAIIRAIALSLLLVPGFIIYRFILFWLSYWTV